MRKTKHEPTFFNLTHRQLIAITQFSEDFICMNTSDIRFGMTGLDLILYIDIRDISDMNMDFTIRKIIIKPDGEIIE